MPVTDRTPQHADHDPFLIAQFVADDVRPGEGALARELVTACTACHALFEDLRTIAGATADLPPVPAAARRPRDFRLTESDAARLRRASWRRWFGFARSPRLAFTQPLGVGMATIGLAGLLISGAFGGLTAGSLPAPESTGGGATVQAAPAEGDQAADASAETGGSEFTTRMADPSADPSAGPAAVASQIAAPAETPAPQAPVGPGGAAGAPGSSPEVETMVGSPAPGTDGTKVGDAAPASGDDAERDAGAEAPAAGGPAPEPGTGLPLGWLALIAAGVVLALVRPIASRLAAR